MAGRAELDPGRGLRAKCKSLSKTTWNHHKRQQNNSVENAFQRFALSFVSFLRRKHDFRRRVSTFVWRILFEEPRIWTSGFNLRTRVLKSVTAAQERLDMRSGCHAAKILPVDVRGAKNVWCLSFLLFSVALPGVRKWLTETLLQNSRKNKTNWCLDSPDFKVLSCFYTEKIQRIKNNFGFSSPKTNLIQKTAEQMIDDVLSLRCFSYPNWYFSF